MTMISILSNTHDWELSIWISLGSDPSSAVQSMDPLTRYWYNLFIWQTLSSTAITREIMARHKVHIIRAERGKVNVYDVHFQLDLNSSTFSSTEKKHLTLCPGQMRGGALSKELSFLHFTDPDKSNKMPPCDHSKLLTKNAFNNWSTIKWFIVLS